MKEKVKQNILIVLGTMLTAFSISVFYVPNKIVSGGVSGMSTILYHIIEIPASVSFAAINVFLLICAYKIIGREFVLKTLFGTGMLSLFIQVFSYVPPVTDNIFLASLFGAVCFNLLDRLVYPQTERFKACLFYNGQGRRDSEISCFNISRAV
jgi:uncharacterized membrane-anchored protein YitT (DUF2179 family)